MLGFVRIIARRIDEPSDAPRPASQRVARRGLVHQLVEALVGEIASGEYLPGETVPSEAELAESFGVARLTVREALKSIAALGMIDVRHGRGSFVTPSDHWSMFEPVVFHAHAAAGDDPDRLWRQLLEVRGVLISDIVRLAALHRSPEDIVAIGAAIDAMRAAHERRAVLDFHHAEVAYEQALVNATGNPLLLPLLRPLANLVHGRTAELGLEAADAVRQSYIEGSATMLELIERGDAAAAEAAWDSVFDPIAHGLLREFGG
jgi:DNA-binding FadR family transcriptional regulator